MASSIFPGFVRLADGQFYLDPKRVTRHALPESSVSRTPYPPDIVMIFSWGSAAPKNIAKYLDAYRDLYQSTCIILVTASTLSANFRSRTSSRLALRPVVKFLQHAIGNDEESRGPPKVLVHVLSNSGLVNFISVSEVYRQLSGTNSTLPHVLLVLDSTPGGDSLMEEHQRWSLGIATGIASYLPWPQICTTVLCTFWIFCVIGIPSLFGVENLASRSRRKLNDTSLLRDSATRLYIYSESDEIIGWRHVWEHATEARQRGWRVIEKRFEGTAHVGHMKTYPGLYMDAIQKARVSHWERGSDRHARKLYD